MLSQIRDGSTRIIAFFDMSLVSFVYIVVERILKSNGVVLRSALNSDSQCSDDRFVCSPRIRYKSSSIKKPWSNDISFEVLFNSSLFEMPSYNLNIGIGIISNFQQMKSIVVPIVTLGDISVVEVVVNVVVMAEVVGRVNPRRFIHKQKLYVDTKIQRICTLSMLSYEQHSNFGFYAGEHIFWSGLKLDTINSEVFQQ